MSKKKKVERPQYEQLADTDWISGLREDLPNYRNQYNYMLGQLDVTSPEVQQAFQDKANEYTQSQWNDFNRSALSNYKAMNQANYNRFGSMGTSGAMYGADSYNRQLNDLASRIASNTAGQYENLMNNYYNQKLTSAQMYGNAYGTAGSTLQNNDIMNWKIRNQNLEQKYLQDLENAQNKKGWFDYVTGIIGGSAQGAGEGFSATGSPWGALGGGIAGGIGGAADVYSGNTNGEYKNALLSPFTSMNSMKMGGFGGGLNLNTKVK